MYYTENVAYRVIYGATLHDAVTVH